MRSQCWASCSPSQLSSTLAKRAETPGVLIAFWRMIGMAVIWNLYLLTTGRHVTWANVRQAFVPGVFFGLNLAVFFSGVTHNSVANAALIGSLAPFLIVPLGAVIFHEFFDSRALVFAVIAFGGAAMVLLNRHRSATPRSWGTCWACSPRSLWAGYVVSTRYFRRQLDVATFMSTITPIAVVVVLPLALLEGDVFGLTRTGWTYTLILTLLTGVVAHGLFVYAQRTIQIGTIGIAQVVQPALAVGGPSCCWANRSRRRRSGGSRSSSRGSSRSC